jgi:hypothetical protein
MPKLDSDDAVFLDLAEIASLEEELDTDEAGFEDVDLQGDEAMGEEHADEASLIEETLDLEDLEFVAEEVEEDAGYWWEESSRDDSWDELEEEWELEALENSYEEEDMEELEAMYENG